MTRIDLYARMCRILRGTAADPVRVALDHFGVDWRDTDTEHLRALCALGRCPKCLQWIGVVDLLHIQCQAGTQ